MAAPATVLEKLKLALDAGVIDQATFDELATTYQARLAGAGAIAQGDGALAVGADSVVVQGDNFGTINLGVLIQLAARPGASLQDLRRAYLARILNQADQLPLVTGDGTGAQVRLSAVYTALLTGRSEAEPADGRAGLRSATNPDHGVRHFSAVDVLNAEPRLALLGGPGSGKSTFVNIVALSMAGESLGIPMPSIATLTSSVPRKMGDHQPPEPQHWDHGALLPVQVVLRELASQLPSPGNDVDAQTLWNFIESRLERAALGDFAPLLREELLQRGGLVLLDGLDEVPDAFDRREQVKRCVQDFVATFSRCRFLVTSRTYAYQRQDWKLDGFVEVPLLPFTTWQIGRFVDAWYAQMAELARLSKADAGRRAEVLKREASRNQRLRELAERPLLLTLIAQLQTRGGGALPERREELYDKAVEMLLEIWEGMKSRPRADGTEEPEPSLAEYLKSDRGRIRRQLDRLAFEAHRDQPLLAGAADIPQAELVNALFKASESDPDARLVRLTEYLRDRAGILIAHGVDMYQFPHRSFQEYLAACHLTDDHFPEQVAELARADPNRWREVALLAGAKAARGSSLSAWLLAETMCPEPPRQGAVTEADFWGALLAGRVLVECVDVGQVAPRDATKLERVREWQQAILRRNTLPSVERALAGRTLAALGDPRPEVMTLDGMHFCFVSPGTFVMGDERGSDDEKPEHVVDLTYAYFIGRFPVTVAQWRDWLQSEGWRGHEPGLQMRANDPAVNVCWVTANAFCEQLTRRWQPLLPPGYEVALPSEAEWEKAARGGEHVVSDLEWLTVQQIGQRWTITTEATLARNPLPRRSYPWGEVFDTEQANAESVIGESSAVGCYPTGRSPYGCEDMSGNVWEWTRSLWGGLGPSQFGYPYDIENATREDPTAQDTVSRVVRGGAWTRSRDSARCACRSKFEPLYQNNDIGFRVVLRPAAYRRK